MSDFLYILDELFVDYSNTNSKSCLTKQFCAMYQMFCISQPPVNNMKYIAPNDLCDGLTNRGIYVVFDGTNCLLPLRNRLIKIRGFGDITYYISSPYVQTHKDVHRKALSRFFRKDGVIKIYNDYITSLQKLKKYLP